MCSIVKAGYDTWLRRARAPIATIAIAVLTACGGDDAPSPPTNAGPPGGIVLQVVSFGDSLLDVGTYGWYAEPNFGGDQFTTNPGQVWAQSVATYYGGSLTPARNGGFTLTGETDGGGLGFAEGGARATLQPGLGAEQSVQHDADTSAIECRHFEQGDLRGRQANASALNGMTPAAFGASIASSLFCSPAMYTVAGADQTYMFADGLHPSTQLHALLAQYVEQRIAASGIGR